MKKTKPQFNVGDLIAVFGGEIKQETESADKVYFCEIISVGQSDLMVEEKSDSYSVRKLFYIVPKDICVKIEIDPTVVVKARCLEPKIGDLVLSYIREAFKKEEPVEITGILYKIVYKFGRPSKATIIHDNEMKEVPFSSLMVLQRN